jgi:hypothetical protein
VAKKCWLCEEKKKGIKFKVPKVDKRLGKKKKNKEEMALATSGTALTYEELGRAVDQAQSSWWTTNLSNAIYDTELQQPDTIPRIGLSLNRPGRIEAVDPHDPSLSARIAEFMYNSVAYYLSNTAPVYTCQLQHCHRISFDEFDRNVFPTLRYRTDNGTPTNQPC